MLGKRYQFEYKNQSVDTDNVLPVMYNWMLRGKKSVLVTLVNSHGSSPRQIGAQMLVGEDGSYFGHIADGCLRSEIILQSQEALKTGRNNFIRYGKDSRFIDITLPCGSGVDLYFDQEFDMELARQATIYYEKRQPFSLKINTKYGISSLKKSDFSNIHQTSFDGIAFQRVYIPPVKLVILGTDPAALLLAQHGVICGMDVQIHTPDILLVRQCLEEGVNARQIINSHQHEIEYVDASTAIIFLFHDLDYEVPLIAPLLRKNILYLGCLGSHKTHNKRSDALLAQNVVQSDIQKIRAPIGLVEHTKSPADLAISIIADIIKTKRDSTAVHGFNQGKLQEVQLC